jgi:hypothetical protein
MLKNQIETILESKPETRNSDTLLMIELWKEFFPQRLRLHNGRLYLTTDDIKDLPQKDTIKRIRALFNQKGKYLPTSEKVLKMRRIKSEKITEGIKDWEEISYKLFS